MDCSVSINGIPLKVLLVLTVVCLDWTAGCDVVQEMVLCFDAARWSTNDESAASRHGH